jgi:hypothetical protein
LCDAKGTKVRVFSNLASLGVKHFHTIFQEQTHHNVDVVLRLLSYFPTLVDEEDNQAIYNEILKEELQAMIASFKKDKSLGPNDWTVEFFKSFFYIMGDDLLHVVEDNGIISEVLRNIKSTLISLIMKLDYPSSFDYFLPISLCNCLYKIVAKIIAMRLNPAFLLRNSIFSKGGLFMNALDRIRRALTPSRP